MTQEDLFLEDILTKKYFKLFLQDSSALHSVISSYIQSRGSYSIFNTLSSLHIKIKELSPIFYGDEVEKLKLFSLYNYSTNSLWKEIGKINSHSFQIEYVLLVKENLFFVFEALIILFLYFRFDSFTKQRKGKIQFNIRQLMFHSTAIVFNMKVDS